MYAYLHKAVLFDGGLPQSHWIHGVVTDLTADQVTVALDGAEPVASFIGNTLWQVPVVVCDSYTLDGPLGPVQGYVPWYGRVATSEEDPVIVYPRQSHRTEVVRQVDAFWDGDSERFMETEEEQEEARLLGVHPQPIPRGARRGAARAAVRSGHEELPRPPRRALRGPHRTTGRWRAGPAIRSDRSRSTTLSD